MPPPPSPPPSSTASSHGKAQMCLLKILRIISLFPAAVDDDDDVSCNKEHYLGHKRFDVDLNIGLGAPKEIEPLELPPAVVTGGGATDCGGCVFLTTNDRCEITDLCFEEKQETVTEQSEISHVGDQSSGVDFNGEELGGEEKVVRDGGDGGGGGGYLDLLIEAAQLILGGDKTESSPPPSRTAGRGGGRKRKKHCWPTTTAEVTAEERWYAEFEDTSPVVKSKRGRNQVLPFRYRDSVVEPLVRRPSSWRRR